MSLGYADRLKNKRNLGGQLGAKEYHQSFDEIQQGVKALTKWVSDAKRVFVFTGAGISTACGIPDFRGPKGIWTLRKKKMPIPTDFTPFEYAKPSFTHMAIAGLVVAGKVPYVCSQNVDSLHLWSGIPRKKLAELHGNCFAERCTECRTEYARDFQMETVDFKPSGRRCTQPGCEGPLVDNILDWDTPLPGDELDEAVQQAEEADLALVLGTSLQIQPANEIPTLTRDEGGKMVIVNLQKTPKDRKASLIIRGRVDVVMALLAQELGLQVPPYVRTERLVVEHELSVGVKAGTVQKDDCEKDSKGSVAAGAAGVLTVRVHSHHGRDCPLPMVESLRISVSEEPGEGSDLGDTSTSGAGGVTQAVDGAEGSRSSGLWMPPSSDLLCSPSPASSSGGGFMHAFAGVPPALKRVRCTLHVRLVKWADADKRDVTLQHTIDLQELTSQATQGAPPRDVPAAEATEGSRGTASAAADTSDSLKDGRENATCRSTAHVHAFVSQEVRYDPADVIAAFLACPPPVVLPERRPKKKHKAESPTAPAVQPTRVSQRRAAVAAAASARKPLPPASETTSSEPSLSSAESEHES